VYTGVVWLRAISGGSNSGIAFTHGDALIPSSPPPSCSDSIICAARGSFAWSTPTLTMTLDLASVTFYELLAFTQRRIDAFASLRRSLDESLSEEQRSDARKEIRFYPARDCGIGWNYYILEAFKATEHARHHELVAQHFLAVLSVNSPPMRTALLHCERLWAQHRGASINAVLALYDNLWHRYRAIDVYNAPEKPLVTLATTLFDKWETMSFAIPAENTYGLSQHNDDGAVVESSDGAPLSLLAYRVRVGYGGVGVEAMRRTLETLINAIALAYMVVSEDPDERDERELLTDEIHCWVVPQPPEPSFADPPLNYMVVLFPSIVVAGNNWALPTQADLLEALDEDEQRELWAVPLADVAWGFYRQCNNYYFNGSRLVLYASEALSLRPTPEQWRRFIDHHERAQASSYVAPTHCAPLRAPTMSARPSVCAPTYTIFKDSNGAVYVRHKDSPGVVVDESGRVLVA
jgi:hypothetical protein